MKAEAVTNVSPARLRSSSVFIVLRKSNAGPPRPATPAFDWTQTGSRVPLLTRSARLSWRSVSRQSADACKEDTPVPARKQSLKYTQSDKLNCHIHVSSFFFLFFLLLSLIHVSALFDRTAIHFEPGFEMSAELVRWREEEKKWQKVI